MTRFIVLRDRTENWRRSAVPLAASVAPMWPDRPADPVIEALDLDPAELRALIWDRSCLTLAPAMPTRIVNPEPLDGLSGADVAPDWGLQAIGADRTQATGAGVRVALMDTGIDPGHPAFDGVTLTTHDFVGTGVSDANGHGTHLAGTVLGRDLGATRIGVARGVTDLLVAKTLCDNGLGQSDSFLQAVLWATGQGADIIAFALSFDIAAEVAALTGAGYPLVQANTAAVNAYRGNLRIFELMMQMQSASGAPLLLGAVGNDSLRMISPEFETGPAAPAAARHVLAIGACGPGPKGGNTGLEPAVFSNAGPALVAPGVGIVSASPWGRPGKGAGGRATQGRPSGAPRRGRDRAGDRDAFTGAALPRALARDLPRNLPRDLPRDLPGECPDDAPQEGLRTLNGSSMALAHATGVAALWVQQMREQREAVTASSLAARLVSTATKAGLAPGQTLLDCGHGLVQAPRAP